MLHDIESTGPEASTNFGIHWTPEHIEPRDIRTAAFVQHTQNITIA
jgi:hypothetical protein